MKLDSGLVSMAEAQDAPTLIPVGRPISLMYVIDDANVCPTDMLSLDLLA